MATNTVSIDLEALKAFTAACVKAKVRYLWGGKIPHRGVPGVDFTGCDCSGFVDEALWRATDGKIDLPAGSWAEEEWVKREGFAVCPHADGSLDDGAVRIAFLPSLEGRARHVVLVAGGLVYQSSGRRGVNVVPWGAQGWMAQTVLYRLSAPAPAPADPAPQPIRAAVLGHDVAGLLVLDDPAPAAHVALRALDRAGVLTLRSVGRDAAEIAPPGGAAVRVAMVNADGVGYAPARAVAAVLGRRVAWDNVGKRVTIE